MKRALRLLESKLTLKRTWQNSKATHSEEIVKAEKEPHKSVSTMQNETIKSLKKKENVCK
jgi:hypothetical protein